MFSTTKENTKSRKEGDNGRIFFESEDVELADVLERSVINSDSIITYMRWNPNLHADKS